MKGWYSLIQYCPDTSRAEVANVGLVLLCPGAHYLDAKMASGNDSVRRIFRTSGDDLDDINEAKAAFKRRIEAERSRSLTLECFKQFQASRGNDLILTEPRATRVDTPDETLQELFDDLVGGRAMGDAIHRERGFSARSGVRSLFERDEFEGLIEERVQVPVPNLPRPFRADYKFENGKPNLVTIPSVRRDVDDTVSRAIKGILSADLLQKHNLAKVIVALPDAPSEISASLTKLSNLYHEYDIRQVRESELEDFGREVLSIAH